MSGTVLILGATGRFGRHSAEAFWNVGWKVRTFDRNTDDLMQAARGVDVIVNAWHPPYTAWKHEVPELTRQLIDAARMSESTVIIPGNIYGYGKGAPPLLSGDTPQSATNPLGRIRIEMEAAYRAAGVNTIVLRAGDYIDTEASGNWFDKIITAKLAKGIVVAPGTMDAPHAWAYLPDLARAAVDLAEKRSTFAQFEEILYPGFTLSLREMNDLLADITDRDLTLKTMSWSPLWLVRPLWPLAAKLLEMRYLWSMPHQLDGTRFARVLPDFKATEPSIAFAQAIRHLDIHPDKPMAGRGLDIVTQ